MPTLDSCITGTFTVGNIGASSGQAPVVVSTPPAAPTITSSDTVSVAEGDTLSHSLTADKYVTWSITGGVDAAQFEIASGVLRWASNGTQDFDAPLDDNTDNAYVVDVRATDVFSNTDDQTITVTVTDVTSAMLTEDGDTMITEDGDIMIKEI